MILTDDEQARALARSHYHNKARVAAIVEDAAELVNGRPRRRVHVDRGYSGDDLLAAALDLPAPAERLRGEAARAARRVMPPPGRVTFFAAVRL